MQTNELDPAAAAREIVEALNAHDIGELRQHWSPSLVEHVPMVGSLDGREAVSAYFEQMFAAIPDFHLDIQRLAADGETVFLRWRMAGTFSGGSWNGVEATGDTIELEGMDCMTFDGGQLVDNFVAYDSMAFAVQAGLIDPPAA